MLTPRCSHCGSTNPQDWFWVQHTRINYAGVSVTETSIEVRTEGAVMNEYLACQCGGTIDQQGHGIAYV